MNLLIPMILALVMFSFSNYGETAQPGSAGDQGCAGWFRVSSPEMLLTGERAGSSMVGTIMALLAMLEEAGVLPPEGTSQANQVIHSVIQLQSAVMKSTSPEFAAYQVAVDRWWQSQHSEGVAGEAKANGLTARVLGAFIAYDQVNSLWDDPSLVLALQAFNVTRADWAIVVDLFQRAETVFRRQGRSLYEVYQGWHMKMPGEPS